MGGLPRARGGGVMGYSTYFEGRFELHKALQPEHLDYLNAFHDTRHMQWNMYAIKKVFNPIREATGLPLGEDGEYFVAREGKEEDWAYALERNEPPKSQPSLYCKWIPSADGKYIQWDGVEKFYGYIEWMEYLIHHFLQPWGYVLNGQAAWQGEDQLDYGLLVVKNNILREEALSEPPWPDFFDE
jgi:hypothetical protein